MGSYFLIQIISQEMLAYWAFSIPEYGLNQQIGQHAARILHFEILMAQKFKWLNSWSTKGLPGNSFKLVKWIDLKFKCHVFDHPKTSKKNIDA